MNFRSPARIALVTLTIAAASLVVPVVSMATGKPPKKSGGGAAARGYPTGAPGVDILAQRGFGSGQNDYAWAMGWFNGKLYVGTSRDEVCVEYETVQFYATQLHIPKKVYTTNPSQNVHCAANPFSMDLRAEIWQYTPQTGTWRMVYRSPVERNPAAPGKMVARDIAYRDMKVYAPPGHRPALYAADVTADEYIPQLHKRYPPRILRSYDGVHWHALNTPDLSVHYYNGIDHNMGFRDLVVWKHHLFVTATPDLTGDGALYEITDILSKHPRFRQVTPPSMQVFEVQTFDGNLYVGNGNTSTGYSVWKTNGSGHPYFNFTPIVTGGAGRGHLITSVVSMHVYRNRLYIGASGWYTGKNPTSELVSVAPNGSWSLVVGNTTTLPNGRKISPTSGLNDGFGNIFNTHFWRMTSSDGGLYVTTNDYEYLLFNNVPPNTNGYADNLLFGVPGFDMWATCDGTDFSAVTKNAFTGNGYDFGGRVMVPHGNDLYIGTADHALGTTILDDFEPWCSSLMRTAGAAAAPSQLLTQGTGHGTLLSWVPSKGAVRYEVMRAADQPLTVSLSALPPEPNGFRFDDQPPNMTSVTAINGVPVSSQPTASAASAGLQRSTLHTSVPGRFVPIATTTSPYFVDPSRGQYIYEVIAVSATGAASDPSNVQMVPDPRPPATFGLLRTMVGGAASAASAGSGSGPAALLRAADAAWQQGERAAAIADLARLQQAASGNDQLSRSAYRLERAIQYASVAGGP